jgi:hypothetical protein
VAKQAELDAANGSRAAPPRAADAAAASSAVGDAVPSLAAPVGASPGASTAPSGHIWISVLAVLAALGAGFWLGYATLARRVTQKFGGIKVY